MQFYTSFFFLLNGAKQIVLVDPVFDPHQTDSIFAAQKDEFIQAYPQSRDIINMRKITIFPSLDSVPVTYDRNVQILCSHFVLEHLKDLDAYFTQARRLLAPNGLCFNYVDVSDHTYHIFYGIPWLRRVYFSRLLYHLRYSDAAFALLNDKRTWVNRILFPEYVQKAGQYDFQIKSKNLQTCPPSPIHKDVLRRLPSVDENELYVSHFTLLLSHDE